MSVGGHSRNYSASIGSRSNHRSRTPSRPPPEFKVSGDDDSGLQPCAATASMFLYARERTVYCLHHDSLALERKFEKHKERIVLLSVDNHSERGQGRLAVSYDIEMTAIVWDIYSGEELARFASYEPLTTASWMKNGNIAFGNSQGNVILFEPATSEHRSTRTIYDPVTALAPAGDCQTYAIGYQNGSVLIASLQPNFTILHTLTTARAPSPVVGIAWHASSSKQRSDMLAIQNADGDLRVWSVAKAPSPEPPKVIRVLKRGDNVESGQNWIAWSKNGRIVQYANGETWAWDVRTKHVAYEQIPTIENVRGMANYGPAASLFTIGPDDSVQQYELNPPALVRTVQVDSFEQFERPSAQNTPKLNPKHIIGAAPPQPIFRALEPLPGPASLATIQEATSQAAIEHAQQLRNGITSPASTSSRAESASSRSSAGGNYRDRAPSVSSRAPSGTVFSALSTPMIARESVASPFWASASVASSGRRSRGSRLKHEVLRSPEVPSVDLFPFTRQRLASLPYTSPQPSSIDQNSASPGELRRQMLRIVFGWDGDIEDMVRNEMERHPPSSASAALLGRWLGETNMNPMSMMASENVSQTDWMLLALSNMSGAGEMGRQMGRSFAQKLINQGDIHTAATVYLGVQDLEEAVDIYVSKNYFMEGIILTCLLFPDEWQRQSHLVRRWGEYVVENSQQHLAVRCFTCTGTNESLPWASPTNPPFAGPKPNQHFPSISNMISPPVSPPGVESPSRTQMMTTMNPALRLITSFGPNEKAGYKFPGLKTDDGTPTMAPGITPIADSALSPGGTPGGARLHPGRGKRAPSHTRLPSIGETPIQTDAPVLAIPNTVKRLPTPETSGSDRDQELTKIEARKIETRIESERGSEKGSESENEEVAPEELEEIVREIEKEKERTLPALSLRTQDLDKKELSTDDALPLLSAAVYNPNEELTAKPQDTPQTAMPTTAVATTAAKMSHSELHAMALARAKESSRARNGSRDRKPNGLHITMPSLDQINLPQLMTAASDKSNRSRSHTRKDSAASSQHSNSSSSVKQGSREIEQGDLPSAPLTGRSWASSMKSPSVSGRSIDPYISSLEEANYYAKKKKEALRAARSRERRSQSRHKSKDETADGRGRASMRFIQPPKRSPSSPVPMSPEDLQQYRQSNVQGIESALSSATFESSTDDQRGYTGRRGHSKIRSQSKISEISYRTVREVSPDNRQRKSSRMGRSRAGSRARSPDRLLSPIERGRSKSKGDGALARSPSSPLPFSPQASLYRESSDAHDPMRLVEANQTRLRSRQRSRQRSTSRLPNERGSSRARREPSQDRGMRHSSRPRHSTRPSDSNILELGERRTSDSLSDEINATRNGLSRPKSLRTIKKEAAARELEARRVSLIAHSQQAIAHPSELGRPQPPERSFSDDLNVAYGRRPSLTPPEHVIREGAPNPLERSASAQPLLGLPATPRAMKHPKYQQGQESLPSVPAVPPQFYATGQPVYELTRSATAPLPEPEANRNDNGIHPAYQRNIRPSTTKRPNLAPLHEIGRSRQGSVDNGASQHIGSIDETLHPIVEGVGENAVIVVPEYTGPSHSVPSPPPQAILPQLAHLLPGASNEDSVPPPPPPPPKPPHMMAGLGIGTIDVTMDNDNNIQPRKMSVTSYTPSPINKSPPPLMSPPTMSPPARTPPPGYIPMPDPSENIRPGAISPPSHGHRRGRSIDNVSSRITRFAERMRSNSRGRNDTIMREREKKTKSPKPLTEGFGEGINSGLQPGYIAPYETNFSTQKQNGYF